MKNKLHTGSVFAVPLSDGSYTLGQLINHHLINSRSSQDTFAFFNFRFDSLEILEASWAELDLSNCFSIVTTNSSPKSYKWKLLGERDVSILSDFKKDIGNLGLYKKYSTDPSIFLEPFFGLFPWDGFYEDEYLYKHIKRSAKIRDDVKYLKDFTLDELKKILPEKSPKLQNEIAKRS